MASGKRKTIGFRTEEELADAMNEIVNGSDSDAENIPEFSSSEESECESAVQSDNEGDISIPGPSRRQIDVTSTTGFSNNDRQPRIPPFIGNPGVQFSVEDEVDVMSYFDHYITPELIEIVVEQTNLYAQQQIAKMPRPVTKHPRSEEWKPVTVIEMRKFLGLIFLTGIVRKPKLELYWSTRGIFRTPVFSQTMSRNRFQLIQRYLHFSDNNAAGTNEDRLYKIRTILDIVVNKFRTNYIPDREISRDEGMLGWRGRLRFRVYNPSKITKYGILVRMVCESSTGYICNLRIYDGKCGPLTEMVGSLLEPYEGKGYHVYQDNYYNSVRQTNELLQKSIRVCGTIRVNRGLPKNMIEETKKLKKGEVTFRRNLDILLVSHKDKRVVNMISTLHTAEVVETIKRRTGVTKKKPKCIVDYNTHMHGVDTADQYLAYYPFIRKTGHGPHLVQLCSRLMRIQRSDMSSSTQLRIIVPCKVLGTLRTTTALVRVFM